MKTTVVLPDAFPRPSYAHSLFSLVCTAPFFFGVIFARRSIDDEECLAWHQALTLIVDVRRLPSASITVSLARYVRPLVGKGADTIVLGCTHFAFIESLIRDVAGPGVAVIDPAPAVARELRRRLNVESLLAPEDAVASEEYFTTGDPDQGTRVMSRLLGRPIVVRSA